MAVVSERRRTERRNARDEALIKSLYHEHGRSMLAYAQRLTGDRGAAEDIVQETLLRAWTHADQLYEVTSTRGWLLKVIRNIVIDRARAMSVRPAETDQLDEGRSVGSERDHAQGVVDAVTMLDAIGTLPPHHRDVLIEVYYRGKTMPEAARALGIPEGTVRSRVFHAVRSLRTTVLDRDEGVKAVV